MIVAFINDTNFYSNGDCAQENIKNIIQTYTKLYEATGSLVEEQKSFYYVWQWSSSGVREQIKIINMDIEINSTKLA